MKAYTVPVFITVDALDAEEAWETVSAALFDIDSWNELTGLYRSVISTVTIGNKDEVIEDGEPVLDLPCDRCGEAYAVFDGLCAECGGYGVDISVSGKEA